MTKAVTTSDVGVVVGAVVAVGIGTAVGDVSSNRTLESGIPVVDERLLFRPVTNNKTLFQQLLHF